ncbi:alcohol dehydrogenase [Oleiphilus messinensis]|uniref:Alcohol dehydrogenase n=1 Tax=Oleiphilus messinensis TaxID=141451 RepID=A0A1Y0IC40_9GAMM|nr:medium chain dehydrogenase/reductase family protein [Oleiphilus messinensis]ARU58031.1 alcohol dehydrogenase [Oleiphilus messinensis]
MENQLAKIIRPGGVEQIRLVNEPLRPPAENEITIKIEASGVAFADVLMREGLYPGVPRKMLTPGYDLVGRVERKGKSVEDFNVGDRVIALSQTDGNAHFINTATTLVCPCPESIPAPVAVALILNYVTAYQMLHRLARIKPNETVLIHGLAGGVGSALMQLALHADAQVYGTLSQRKWDSLDCMLTGNERLTKIDYQSEPFEAAIKRHCADGVDVVFDAVGGQHLKRSYQTLIPFGRVISYGFSTAIHNGRRNWLKAGNGILKGLFSAVDLIATSKTVSGYGIWVAAHAHPDWFQQDMQAVLDLYEAGIINPLISKTLPLAEIQQAHRLMESSQVPGKIVLMNEH